MKHLKTFGQINEELDDYTSPIHYNSGAYSFHLNFDINDITDYDPLIYPGMEYTTNSSGASLLEEFAMAIQKYDLEKIGTFFDGKKTHFDQQKWLVTCGTNNFYIREIPYEVWKSYRFHGDYRYGNNMISEREFNLTTKIEELENDKIYTCSQQRKYDYSKENGGYFTGVIDVTQPVKTFIEKTKSLSEPIEVQERYRSYRR